jgi:uncharacterized membrane protein
MRRIAAIAMVVLNLVSSIGIGALAGYGTGLVAIGFGAGYGAVILSGVFVYFTTLVLVLYVMSDAFKPEARRLLPRLERVAAAHGLTFDVRDVSGRQHEAERSALLSSFKPVQLTTDTLKLA